MAVAEDHQRHSWYERLLNLISVVKPGEGRSCVLLTANATILMACYYLLKVIREPLILAYGGAEYKSYATAIQAFVLMLLIPIFSVLYHRHAASSKPGTIINRVLLFFASNLLIFIFLDYININIGVAFYVWLGIFSVMVVAQFWAFAADSYNVRVGQRLFVILAVGSTLGSWLGAKLAGPIFPYFGVPGILFLAMTALVVSVFLTRMTPAAIPEEASNEEKPQKEGNENNWKDGFSVVFQSRYLLLIAAFVVLLIFINSTGEYILARLVSEESLRIFSSDQTDLIENWQTQFYSSYYSWITLLSFLIQLFLVSRLINWIGLRGSVLVLPIIMIIGYGLMFFFPIFSIIRYAMIAENSSNYSIQNTTRHALFLPVPRKHKYLGKTTIETFFYRVGDLLYGFFIFFGAQYFNWPLEAFIASNLILAVGLLLLAMRVGHHNTIAKQKVLGNSPPVVVAALPQLHMPVGIMSKFSISECTFDDPDIGDALKYHAQQSSGEGLPKWIRFDRMTRTFTFQPPHEHTQSMSIEIHATDFEGLTATNLMKVSFFKPDDAEELS